MQKRKLYKYKAFNEYTLHALKNNEIWYSDPRYFNDVFDTYAMIDQIRRELTYGELVELRKNGSISEVHFDRLKLSLDDNVGILSLTTECKSNVMWAHYGDYHKGFCMEFEFEYNDKEDHFKSCHWNMCDYCDKNVCDCPDKDMWDILPKVYKYAYKVRYSKLYEKVENLTTSISNYTDIFLRKSDEWEYENEYRIIMSLQNKKRIIGVLETILYFNIPEKYSQSKKKIENILTLINNDYFDNCIDIIKLMIKDIENLGEFNKIVKDLINILIKELGRTGQVGEFPSKLTSIIFGYRMSLENKKLIKDALSDFKTITYKRIVPSESSYELIIENETFL